MKKLTIDEVADALMTFASCEMEGGAPCYYLHLKEDGTIVSNFRDADVSLTAIANYDMTGNEIDSIWEQETMGNPAFREVVEALTKDANDWLSNN